jgi:hypothetical protein
MNAPQEGRRVVVVRDEPELTELTEDFVVSLVRAQFRNRRATYGKDLPDVFVLVAQAPSFKKTCADDTVDASTLIFGNKAATLFAAGVLVEVGMDFPPELASEMEEMALGCIDTALHQVLDGKRVPE